MYDIVIGPIADDAVGVQIRQLSRGFITFDKFLESIKYTAPTFQFFRDRKSNQIIDEDMTATDRQFLIESLCEDIVPMIMEEYQLTDKEAFDKLYKSTTFSKVEDPETGLYYQSPVYVFDMLKEEFNAD